MSHASLKDQLLAVVGQLSDTYKDGVKQTDKAGSIKQKLKSNDSRPDKTPRVNSKPVVTPEKKPKWLQYAQNGIELLQKNFPECFKNKQNLLPLKVGIKKDLIKRLQVLEIKNEDKACMVKSLSYYVNMLSYHKKITEGAVRVDLEGKPCGLVSAKEAQYSAEKIKIKSDRHQQLPK